MFKSATVRLTIWYLLILMFLSIVFSFVVYQISFHEVEARLNRFQIGMSVQHAPIPGPIMAESLRNDELDRAKNNLLIELVYVNIFIFTAGGFASFFLARRSLLPIEKAHEEQSRFTSDASHELRTPLAIMKTELEVSLRDKSAKTKDLRQTISSSLEEVNNLSKLAEMLLNLSQIDKTELKFEPINLSKVSAKTVQAFQLQQKRIIANYEKNTLVRGNETAIIDLIKILIDNALAYSPNDSQIKISVTNNDQSAQFEITNVGPGIQQDKLPFIFDRFYRADSSRTSGDKKSYGLGLALAKKIVELHNGKIHVISIPNKTTTFTFFVPHI